MDNEQEQYVEQEANKALGERLVSYSFINSLYNTYSSVKESSVLLKYGLETAESVLKELDSTLGLEEKGSQVLDQIEDRVTYISELYHDGTEYVSQKKEEANRQVNQMLDVTEKLVDQLLPPSMEFEEVSLATEGEVDRLNSNPIPRVTSLGYQVPIRIKAAALNKLSSFSTLDLTNPTQLESFSHVVDLIQYATDYIDVDKQKQALLNASEAVRDKVNTNLESVNHNLVTIKEIVDKHTEDIKNAGVKTVVGVVATIAQAVEVARRQLLNHFGSRQKLQEELIDYTVAAKKAILSLKDKELVDYVNLVKANSHQALTKILDLVNTHVPTHLLQNIPGLESFAESILVWRESINQRLSAALQDISKEKQVNQESIH